MIKSENDLTINEKFLDGDNEISEILKNRSSLSGYEHKFNEV